MGKKSRQGSYGIQPLVAFHLGLFNASFMAEPELKRVVCVCDDTKMFTKQVADNRVSAVFYA